MIDATTSREERITASTTKHKNVTTQQEVGNEIWMEHLAFSERQQNVRKLVADDGIPLFYVILRRTSTKHPAEKGKVDLLGSGSASGTQLLTPVSASPRTAVR